MKILKQIIILGLFITIIGCKGNFISIEEICKKHDILIPTASEFPNDDAVIILDKTEWEMKITENFDLNTSKERHIVKKIFKNLNEHSIIKIPVFKGDEIFNISARTIKPNGTIIPVEKSDIYTIDGVEDGSQFYSDMKYKKFTFPGLEEGCII
ncbi:MAG: DUF3857 domain-containing protein, partial [Candidatus Cloacimonadota bacterium]|nr:DUF3857 domain-containing protein [Candidatus Cloacimonadota bacterium]